MLYHSRAGISRKLEAGNISRGAGSPLPARFKSFKLDLAGRLNGRGQALRLKY
jgi:hypothetical protein